MAEIDKGDESRSFRNRRCRDPKIGDRNCRSFVRLKNGSRQVLLEVSVRQRGGRQVVGHVDHVDINDPGENKFCYQPFAKKLC